jgi:hypothetical protein
LQQPTPEPPLPNPTDSNNSVTEMVELDSVTDDGVTNDVTEIVELDRVTDFVRSQANLDFESSIHSRLCKLYDEPTKIDLFVEVHISGKPTRICAFRYPTGRNFDLQPKQWKQRYFFLDHGKLNDSVYVTFKYQCCAAYVLKRNLSVRKNKQTEQAGIAYKSNVVYFTMCALGHPKYPTGKYALLQVFMTLCTTAESHFLICDATQMGKPGEIVTSMGDFYCVPSYIYPDKTYDELVEFRKREIKKRSLIFNRDYGRPVDTKQPHSLNNLEPVELTLDVKKQVWRSLLKWSPLPGAIDMDNEDDENLRQASFVSLWVASDDMREFRAVYMENGKSTKSGNNMVPQSNSS